MSEFTPTVGDRVTSHRLPPNTVGTVVAVIRRVKVARVQYRTLTPGSGGRSLSVKADLHFETIAPATDGRAV